MEQGTKRAKRDQENRHSVDRFKEHLRNLPNKDKDALWLWLDTSADAIHEMIECVGRPDGMLNTEAVIANRNVVAQ